MNDLAERVAVVALGAFTLAAQTALLRVHLVAGDGGELAVGLFFATWLLWIAVGAALHARATPAGDRALRRLLVLAALYVPALALQFAALSSLRWLAGVPPSDLFPLGRLVLATAAVNAPVGLVTGACFPAACAALGRAEERADHTATGTYVLEALGAFVGGAGATVLVMAGRSSLTVAAIAAAVLCAAFGALAWVRRDRLMVVPLALGAVAAGALGLSPLGGTVAERIEGLRFDRALPEVERFQTLDTPHRHLVLGWRGDQLLALSDGSVLAAMPDDEAAIVTAALLTAQAPSPDRILLIGQGAEPLAVELLAYDPTRLVHLQPDAAAAEALFEHIPPGHASRLDHAALERTFGDARRFLGEASAGRHRFDLVVLDQADPTSAAANRVTTAGFFERCRAVLAEGGVLATRITSTVNYRDTDTASYGAAMATTLEHVFDEVAVVPGETTWLLAGAAGAPCSDPDELARRHVALSEGQPAVPPQTFASLVDPRRVREVHDELERIQRTRGDDLLNTDGSPIAYFLQLKVLARTTGDRIGAGLDAARAAGVWLYLLPLFAAAVLWLRQPLLWPDRHRDRRRTGAALIALAGGCSIALQVCLVLGFQNRFGNLYGQIGWLNALFMIGLAGGGYVGTRQMERFTIPGGAVVAFGGAAAALAGLVCLGLPVLARVGDGTALAAWYLLVGGTGLVFGAGFPVAGALAAAGDRGPAEVGAVLEAADHWGAAAGAALVGVLMIPLLGPSTTAGVLALVLAAAAVVLPLPTGLQVARANREGIGRLLGWLEARGRRHALPGREAAGWLLGGCLALVAVAGVVRGHGEGPRIRFDADELRAFGGTAGAIEVEEPFVHYRNHGDGSVLLSSMAVTTSIQGYGGPLNLQVVLDAAGSIGDVRLLESDETPAYLVGFDRWLNGLRGWPHDEPLAGVAEVVTGATVTSEAALATVDEVRHAVATQVLDIEPPPRAAVHSPWRRVGVVVLALLLVAAPLAAISGDRWLRLALMALSLGAAGLWLNLQLSGEHLAFFARLDFPGGSNAEGALLLGGAVVLGAAFGAVYCGVLCPFGAAQEWLSGLGPGLTPSPRLDRALRALKYVLAALALVGLLLTGTTDVLGFDPLGTRLGMRASGTLLGLVLLAGAGALLYRRFWCRYLCLVGAFTALFNRVALLRRWLPRRQYDRCDLGVTSAADWDCIQCNRCAWLPADLGEVDPARGRIADRLLLLLTGVVLALALWTVADSWSLGVDLGGQTRAVDTDEIRRQIESRELSDHPAEFWESVD